MNDFEDALRTASETETAGEGYHAEHSSVCGREALLPPLR